jgi:hypothetical protein
MAERDDSDVHSVDIHGPGPGEHLLVADALEACQDVDSIRLVAEVDCTTFPLEQALRYTRTPEPNFDRTVIIRLAARLPLMTTSQEMVPGTARVHVPGPANLGLHYFMIEYLVPLSCYVAGVRAGPGEADQVMA